MKALMATKLSIDFLCDIFPLPSPLKTTIDTLFRPGRNQMTQKARNKAFGMNNVYGDSEIQDRAMQTIFLKFLKCSSLNF